MTQGLALGVALFLGLLELMNPGPRLLATFPDAQATPSFYGLLLVAAVAHGWLPERLRPMFLIAVSVGWLVGLGPQASVVFALYTGAVIGAVATVGRRWPRLPVAIAVGGLVLSRVAGPIAFNADWLSVAAWAMPFGFGYYGIRLVHYAIEAKKGKLRDRDPISALAWISTFFLLHTGPIFRFDRFGARDVVDEDRVARGVSRIVVGVAKALLIGDLLLGAIVPDVAAIEAGILERSTAWTWAAVFGFYVQRYVAFAGYTDVAVGAGLLFGLRVPENFDWPLLAPNLVQYWRRYHQSIGAFCQTYVYLPMIGRTRSPYLANFASFLIMGLWHGVSVNWFVWSALNAAGVLFVQAWHRRRRALGLEWLDQGVVGGLLRPVGTALTLAWVTITVAWVVPMWDAWLGVRIVAKLFGLELAA